VSSFLKNKKNLIFLLRIGVSISVILFLFKKIHFAQILEILKKSNLFLILVAFLFCILLHFLGVLRWKVLISCNMKTSFFHLAFPFFSGLFFNLFFPSVLAGDLFRGAVLFNKKRSAPFILTSVLLDRIIGFLALASVCLISFLLNPKLMREKDVLGIVLIFFFGLIFTLLIIFSKKVLNIFSKICKKLSFNFENWKKSLIFFRENPKVILKALGISYLIQIGSILSIWLVFLSFGKSLNILDVFTLGTISTFISLLPVSIAGLGIRDLSFIFFFSKVGVESSVSFSASLLIFTYNVIMSLTGGVIFALLYNRWLQLNKQFTSLKE